jgi:hypothetical protein
VAALKLVILTMSVVPATSTPAVSPRFTSMEP